MKPNKGNKDRAQSNKTGLRNRTVDKKEGILQSQEPTKLYIHIIEPTKLYII